MRRGTRILFLLILLIALALPAPLFARVCAEPEFGPTGLGCSILPCSGFGFLNFGGSLPKCTNLCQLVKLGQNVAYYGMNLVVFVLAPLVMGWGALLIIIGRSSLEEIGGSSANITRGKGVLMSGVIGVLIALGSFLILNTFFFVLGIGGLGGPGSSWTALVCEVPRPLPP